MLAVHAAQCSFEADPDDLDRRWWRATAWQQAHRFEEAAVEARWLVRRRGHVSDYVLLGDALAEMGDWAGASRAWQRAMDLRPGPVVYDRFGWFYEHQGDLQRAERAYDLATGSSDEAMQLWSLTRLAAVHLQMGLPAPELDWALALSDSYAPALALARGEAPTRRSDGW